MFAGAVSRDGVTVSQPLTDEVYLIEISKSWLLLFNNPKAVAGAVEPSAAPIFMELGEIAGWSNAPIGTAKHNSKTRRVSTSFN